jgi:hypothetical protein
MRYVRGRGEGWSYYLIEGSSVRPSSIAVVKAVFEESPTNNNTEKSRKIIGATSPLTEFVVSVHLMGTYHPHPTQ